MKKYQIEICETLCQVVEQEANSPDEAVKIVDEQYRDGIIELSVNNADSDYTIKAL